MQLPEPQKPLIKIGHNRGGSELIHFKILFADFLSPVAFINATVHPAHSQYVKHEPNSQLKQAIHSQ